MADDSGVDIRALAKLARLEITDEEIQKLEREIPPILAFIETIQKASGEASQVESGLRNVMRDDDNAHESGMHTDDLLADAPEKKDGKIVVKQVISRKK
jgi:aspartyl-tRNA(Asn)/glutamyl-tRNA(Gln) amidotransferase subunit C